MITYVHAHWKSRDPVHSLVDKPVKVSPAVGSVRTNESPEFPGVVHLFLPFSCPLLLFGRDLGVRVQWENSGPSLHRVLSFGRVPKQNRIVWACPYLHGL